MRLQLQSFLALAALSSVFAGSDCDEQGNKADTQVKNLISDVKLTTAGRRYPEPQQQAGGSGFPSVNGMHFNIDGKTQYWTGTNAYWLSSYMTDSDVDHALDVMKDAGLKIIRVWGFNDVSEVPSNETVWFQSFAGDTPVINTGANGLQRLDYAVSAAAKRGLKLILPLVNNWPAFGGHQVYCDHFGVGTDDPSLWYTNQAIQAQYQTYVRTVVNRYKNSKAIFAWELGNEPRCIDCNTQVVTNWARKSSAFIKQLDPNHMVAVGDEGFGVPGNPNQNQYGPKQGLNWPALIALPHIDFATFHVYYESWKIGPQFGTQWVKYHAAACRKAGKPCLFEEYSSKNDKCELQSPWQDAALNTPGVAGDMFWQIGVSLPWGKSANDGYTIYKGTPAWKCLVNKHRNKVRIYNQRNPVN